MKTPRNLWRYATSAVACAVVALSFGFARLPRLSPEDRTALASQFKFERLPIPRPAGPLRHPDGVRRVHPSFHAIASWISATGASISLTDLDADGLANDACSVDPRFEQVTLAAVPGTGDRFASFALEPAPLPYDASTMAPMGCLPGDFNEDGATDLLVYYWGRTPVLFLRRTLATGATGTAPAADQYRPVELVAGRELWNSSVATQADLDGDGHVDLIVGNYFQDGARVLDAGDVGDVGGRGHEEMQATMSRAANGGVNRIFRFLSGAAGPEPTARFAEVRDVFAPEVARGWTLATGAADLDGDLLPEIYFANDFGPDRLLYNVSRPGHVRFVRVEGVKTFFTPSSKVLGHDSYKSMGVDFGDLDGDGLTDIFVSNITHQYALEESHFAFINTGKKADLRDGIAPFVDRSEEMGLSRSGFSWEARLGDFNNDGVLEVMQADGFVKGRIDRWPELQELAMGSDLLLRHPGHWPRFRPGDDLSGHIHNPFFVRSASGRFYDLAADCGIGEQHVSRAIATADVNGDGRLDFALANQWEDSYFYQNVSPQPGSYLALQVRLPVDGAAADAVQVWDGTSVPAVRSRPAIGAAATVYLPDGRQLVGAVDGGSGHAGHRSPSLHFGLGRLAPGERVRVALRWRDGQGTAHRRELQLAAGWHTVLLGSKGKES